MSALRSVTAVLLLISYLIASSFAAESSWIVLSDIKAEDLPANLNRETSHELLLKYLSKKNVHQLIFDLRNEFYTMATGKDFYRLIVDYGENKELHAIAEASLILSQKLPHMGIVNNVIRTAIANAAHSVYKQGDISKAFPVIKENIEKLMQDPPAPYEEYKRLKNEALAKPWPADYKIYYYEIPKTLDDAKKILAESLNEPYLKKLMVHSTFGNETRKHAAFSKESFLLAKSILELSKDPELGAKVQALYDEAVAETANTIEDVEAKNVNEKHVRESFIQIAKQFFKTLANKFENDPAIKTKFAETKELLSKSQ